MRFMCIFYDISMCSLMCETNMSVVYETFPMRDMLGIWKVVTNRTTSEIFNIGCWLTWS